MKGVLAGVAFLFSVGAVSTKLLGSRYPDFCFCSPPLAQPAFTAPSDEHKDAAIMGGALPARVVAERAAIQVEAFNVDAHHDAAGGGGLGSQSRAVSHLGLLWGTDGRNWHGWSGNGSFMGHGGGTVGGGMIAGGGRTQGNSNSSSHTSTSSSATSHSSSPRPSSPASPAPPAVSAPPAGLIVPPATGSFAGNCAPVPGFGTGSTGGTTGTTGVTLGGIPIGGPGGKGLSVTPEPATLLLTLTGLFFAIVIVRRDRRHV